MRVLEYDARGNVVRETDENQKVTVREYDSEDNLTKEVDPLLHETKYFYDADNDLQRIVDPLGITRRSSPTTTGARC